MCDLGIYIDADTAMKSHITTTVKACFSALRQIRSVRCSPSQHALLTLIRALVVSKVDLQLRTRRYFWSSYGQVAVYPERHCSAGFLGEEVRARNATAS